jgi:LmbE family N-acetylglucosaminyl deacetylase
MAAERLMAIRMAEQANAARVIGAKQVDFFEYPDGYLIPDLEMRKRIVRHVRAQQPEIIVTSDPLNYYIRGKHINHPDHRTAGQATLDAVFPAAGNRFFFPELIQEGLLPVTPEEVWISLTQDPTVIVDVTETWQTKVDALLCHASQIGDPQVFCAAMLERRTADSSAEHPRYEEGFRRLLKR